VLVDPSRVGYEDRLRLLEHMVKRLGASRAAEALGVAKMTVYRMLRGEAPHRRLEAGEDTLSNTGGGGSRGPGR